MSRLPLNLPHEQIRAEIFALVAEQAGAEISALTEQTKLNHDLGIAGDDGVELFLEIQRRYQVDLSGFDCGKYFGGEGFNPIEVVLFFIYRLPVALWRRVFRGTPFTDGWDAEPPITIGDVIRAVETGRWCGKTEEQETRDSSETTK